jgi:hypothetical protein
MGGSQSPAPQQQDNSATLAMIAQMQAQQASAQQQAQRAQERAIYNSQVQAANQAKNVGMQTAQQQLGLQDQYQQAKDASALAEAQRQSSAAGAAATGGGYDFAETQKAQLSNLGAASGMLPQTMANIGGISPIKNPAATTAGSMTAAANRGVTGANQFQMPTTEGLAIR